MRYIKSGLLFLSIYHSLVFAQGLRPTVAVIDFDAHGISAEEVQSLSDRFRTALTKTRKLILVERGLMQEILSEQDFQLSGCTSDECAVEVGQLLGVQFIFGGSIGKVGRTYTIDTRMISVETGATEKSRDATFVGDIDGLINEIEILAFEIMELEPTVEMLEKRRLGTQVYLAQQTGNIPTRSGAILRSTIFPGFGQIYSGRKVTGYSLLVSEIVILGLVALESSNYQSALNDYNQYHNLYEVETELVKIYDYKELSMRSHNKVTKTKKKIENLGKIAGSLWLLNIVHAYLRGPSAVRVGFQPPTKSDLNMDNVYSLRWEFALD